MSAGGSELHRFGIDPDSPPDQRQWENVCRFLKALLNNPHLQIGNSNSQIVFPEPPIDPLRSSKGYLGRFIISVRAGKVFVSPGEVAFVEMCGSTDEEVVPLMPTLDGTPLDDEDTPFWDAGAESLSAGNRYAVRVVLDRTEPFMELAGDSDENENEVDVFVVGYFTLKNVGGTLVKDTIEQKWKSDIIWPKEESSSSSSSVSSSSVSHDSQASENPPEDSDGSDKSTAIVPAPWSKHGFTALFTMEAPEVLFEDVMVIPVHAESFAWPMDSRFVAVCERNSIQAVGITAEAPALLGVKVEGSKLFVEIETYGKRRPAFVTVKLCGVRKGFAGMRFPDRDREQFLANEATLNAAYPAKELH